MSDVPKKKRMLVYLLETRRQMIKMLVLVKWAKVAKDVEQCIVQDRWSTTDVRMWSIFCTDNGIALIISYSRYSRFDIS